MSCLAEMSPFIQSDGLIAQRNDHRELNCQKTSLKGLKNTRWCKNCNGNLFRSGGIEGDGSDLGINGRLLAPSLPWRLGANSTSVFAVSRSRKSRTINCTLLTSHQPAGQGEVCCTLSDEYINELLW